MAMTDPGPTTVILPTVEPDKFGDVTTTVADLIRALQQMPPTARVLTEGCDCIGMARSLDYDADQHAVTINRT